jgi:cobyrinic acid a,c-diamide synthase
VSKSRRCPALFISAPASHQGKTTVTAALARHHRNQGRRVRVFKTGPDFLDPMILSQASGNPVYQLDLWMVGESTCKRLLYDAAGEADLILIEGVMGLFDGEPSSADLAENFGVPIMVVIDASGMAETFNAIAYGLETFRPTLPFAGVFANRVASDRHLDMITGKVPTGSRFLGHLRRDESIELPERHLGVKQADEIADLEARLSAAAKAIAASTFTYLPEPIDFHPEPANSCPKLLTGLNIAVAKDNAFSFIYDDNLQLLKDMGAKIDFFSPLTDSTVPRADAIYLPGGYPELHLDALRSNFGMKQAIHAHVSTGKPLYAECGGMLYLLDSLTDSIGKSAPMAGVIRGHAVMQKKLSALGYQSITLPQGKLHGHTFHYSRLLQHGPITDYAERKYDNAWGEPIFRTDSVFASYVHLYFRSNPTAAASLFLTGANSATNTF